MKHHLAITLATGASLLFASAVFGQSQANEERAVELPEYTVYDIATLPAPTHSPIPQVSTHLVGLDLKIRLTVNAQGRPESVRLERPLSSYSDIHEMTFASQMRDLVAGWKFTPAVNIRGEQVPVNLVMPVKVVRKAGRTTALASLTLDQTQPDRT